MGVDSFKNFSQERKDQDKEEPEGALTRKKFSSMEEKGPNIPTIGRRRGKQERTDLKGTEKETNA